MLDLLLSYAGGTDRFEPGFYRWERRGHVPVPVRVWFGPPRDPATGELLDRSWRWQFEFGGFTLDAFAGAVGFPADSILESFWPRCQAHKIGQSEYRFLLDTAEHAREHDPASPFASTRGKVDLLSASIPTVGA